MYKGGAIKILIEKGGASIESLRSTDLIDYEDGQEELDSLRSDKIYAGIQISKKSEKHFPEIDTNSERNLGFRKQLLLCISGYRYVHKQLTNRPSSQKLITYFMVSINKSIEIVSSSDENYFQLIHHRKMRDLDYDEYQRISI
ncbi:uncharacterized protein TNCV_3820191 [Trichonephila clavipes]|uniref:Uncharacterized protein n=1 Tax=Trichonephila clavipes TaxID=2585209 RepID=A0A8X6R714_TRICX|nr:uncharacterized protein TNCV_3820191 [Trichonephila clavipes]